MRRLDAIGYFSGTREKVSLISMKCENHQLYNEEVLNLKTSGKIVKKNWGFYALPIMHIIMVESGYRVYDCL